MCGNKLEGMQFKKMGTNVVCFSLFSAFCPVNK